MSVFASTAYVLGAVFGALFFGWLTDRLGRKNSSSSSSLTVYLTFRRPRASRRVRRFSVG